jgi:hypothetical protein
MFIELLVDFINLLKNQGQSRYYSPEDIMSAFNRSQLDLFREYYKKFEDTQEIMDSLQPFKKDYETPTPQPVNPLPSDYVHLTEFNITIDGTEYSGKIVPDEAWNIRELAMLQKYFGDNIESFKYSSEIALVSGVGNLPGDFVKEIEGEAIFDEGTSELDITNEHQFIRRKNERTYPPANQYPVAWVGNHEITVEPNTVSSVKLYYYRFPAPTRPLGRISGGNLLIKPLVGAESLKMSYLKPPVDAVYAYTVVDSRNLLFDESNSTDTEFMETDHSALVLKTLQYLGIALKDQFLVQFEGLKQDIKAE